MPAVSWNWRVAVGKRLPCCRKRYIRLRRSVDTSVPEGHGGIASAADTGCEMRRILPAFAGLEVVYVSTEPASAADLAGLHATTRCATSSAATGWAWRCWAGSWPASSLRERPEVVVTTGAAPWLVGSGAGQAPAAQPHRLDRLRSPRRADVALGQLARCVADVWLTQWPHLARPGGPRVLGGGAVIFVTVGSMIPVRPADAGRWTAGRRRIRRGRGAGPDRRRQLPSRCTCAGSAGWNGPSSTRRSQEPG